MAIEELDLGKYQLGWNDAESYVFKPAKGINEQVVRDISWWKGEPDWMTKFRLRSLKHFERKPMNPWFSSRMPNIDFNDIYYYIKPTEGGVVDEWDQVPEKMKQTYEKLGIPEAERKYLAGVTAQYECLRGDARVWTTDGYRAIKEIEPGELVFSLDESTKQIVVAPVTTVACSGEKEVFEITARGRVIGASANHPFLVLRDERKPGRQRARFATRWLPVEDLREGDLVAIATDVPEFGQPFAMLRPEGCGNYPGLSSVDLMWWAGVFIGDGYIHHRSGYDSVEIAIDKTDSVLIDEIIRVTDDLFGIELRIATDGLRLVGRATGALADYLHFNALSGNAHSKRVPAWVLGLPHDQRLAFFAGYVDADGYVRDSKSSKNVVLTSASETLLRDMRELAVLCGIGTGTVRHFTSKHPHDAERRIDAYRLHLSGRFDRLPVRSPRRANRLDKRQYSHGYTTAKGATFKAHTSDTLGFVKIESIKSVAGIESVYDITVEGHHNFVAEGFVVHNSEVVYHRNREDLAAQGIIFCDMDTALREYPELVKQYFGTVIPPGDNKFAALNSAVWSGGSFIYVPPGVNCELPLQAYFRINSENAGQFERTLIIADEGAQVHYIEGCSAPVYAKDTDSLHSAVVELIAKKSARITYTTIQNWSNNVYNLVTKRGRADAEARIEWIDGNIGSKLTMKYPSVYLMGPKASGEVLSVAYAGPDQWQDAGAKMYHSAPETTSTIVSKSISQGGGRTTYRGLVHVDEGATKSKSFVHYDTLILDEDSQSDTYPYMEVGERDAQIGHEATVSKIGSEQLFYLMSRGLSEEQAMGMIVNGFIEPITRTLPMEYAVEWSRLIELQMEGSVG